MPLKPLAPKVLGLFFALATFICLTAGISLLWPETPLSGIWAIKPREYRELLALAPWSGLGFTILAVLMATTSFATFQRTKWGWRLAIVIFAVNGAADAARLVMGDVFEGAIGVVVAGAILVVLSRSSVRSVFDR